MVVNHAAGRDYPRSYAELRAWFDEDWKCLDYLDWLRESHRTPAQRERPTSPLRFNRKLSSC